MGNPQHLEWLLEGVEAWNARRASGELTPRFTDSNVHLAFKETEKLNSANRIPLEGVNLAGANIQGADMRNSDLSYATLKKANLFGIKLTDSRINHAHIVGADLRVANLDGATFLGTDLDGSDLTKAILVGADLSRASLFDATISAAVLEGANLANADLRLTTTRTVYTLDHNNSGSLAPIYTDLSETVGLVQAQINVMDGDTGTILPEGLTHPPHWPDPAPYEVPPAAPDHPEHRLVAVPNASPGQPAALKAQVQIILAAPVQNANTAETFAAQLDYATQTFRQANNCNDLPYDLLLVEQVSDTFKQLAKAIHSTNEGKLAKELANALTKIEELREIIEKQTAEIEALKKKGGESSVWRKGSSAFAISFGTALGAGTAAAILSGGEIMLGEYGASALNGLRNAFDGLFQAPPPPPPPSLPPSIGT